MSVKIALKNFQSIGQAKFLFEPGFTVIVGPNSSGKTAVFRAIKAMLLNPAKGAKGYIKHNQEFAQVGIRIDEGETYVWTRTESSSAYKINEEVYAKAGRTKMHTLRPKFPLLVDEAGKIMNMQTEHDCLFPFDKSPADLFKMFEDVFQISNAEVILELIRADEQTATSKMTELKALKEKNQAKRIAIEEFKKVVDLVKLKACQSQWQQMETGMGDLVKDSELTLALVHDVGIADSIKKQEFNQDVFNQIQAINEDLPKVEDLKKQILLARECVKKEFDVSGLSQLTNIQGDVEQAQKLEKVSDVVLTKREFDWQKVADLFDSKFSADRAEAYESDIEKDVKDIAELTYAAGKIGAALSNQKACPLCKKPI